MHPTNGPLSRRFLLRGGLAAVAAGALPPARACEFFVPTLRIVHPWVRASAPDAIDAALVMVFDDVTRADRLVGVETPVASGAELSHAGEGDAFDLPIAAGRTLELSESGLHVRLTGLRRPLLVGRTHPLTLRFAEGGSIVASLSVDYARFF